MNVGALHAGNFEELHAIHHPNYNIGFLDISDFDTETPRAYLRDNFEKLPTFFKCIVSKDNFEESIKELDNLYYVMDECAEKQALIDFVKTLTSHFADVTDAPDMGISLEKVEGDLCKYFHYDMNHLRLVYPLLGPGTLWLNEDNVRREHLGKGKNELVVIDHTKIHKAHEKNITLLKGHAHPSAKGRAVVHASPPIKGTNEKRVLFRIESMF